MKQSQPRPAALSFRPVIVYEFPFNESIRAWLRLEQLLARLDTMRSRDTGLDHHMALATLFEVLEVAARGELKGELLQEIDRHRRQLNALRGNPAVAAAVLEQTLTELDRCSTLLNEAQGKIGQALAGHEWLAAVRSRLAIPGGSCSFDLPAYHAWLQGDPAKRRADLAQWVAALQPWSRTIAVVLGLVRSNGSSQACVATRGRFQHSLTSTRPALLAQLTLADAGPWIPEISGNRLLLVVRMLRTDDALRLEPARDDVPFQLTLCH